MNTSKRNYLSLVSLVLIVLIVSTVMLVNSKKDSSVISNDDSKEIVDLVFKPVEIEPLKELEIGEEYEYIQTIELEGLKGKLHLYLKVEEDIEVESKEIYGFIEHDNKFYETSLLSAYGMNDMSVKFLDITNDGREEIKITGSLGSSYAEIKIISYDEIEKQWVNLLTMGTPYIIDLDGDGFNELIGVSSGSMPSFVNIYRWNGEFFVQSSVTESTSNIYAHMFNTGYTKENDYIQDGDWIIETGNEEEPNYYTYEQGKLIKIPLD